MMCRLVLLFVLTLSIASCTSQKSKLMNQYSGLWIVDSIYIENNIERSFKLNTLLLEADGTCSTPIRVNRYHFDSMGKWTIFNENEEPMLELYNCSDEIFDGDYSIEYKQFNNVFLFNLKSKSVALFCSRNKELFDQ